MVDPRGNSPKEIDLETLFAESFSALPPDEVVEKVNPFRRAVNRVLIGMALCTLTLNFWGLNYILPTVGMVLSLLGFRALRRENGCFTACFVLTLLRCVQFFPTIVLNAFPCRDDFIPERVTTSLAQVSFAAQLLGLFCLWLGLRAVQRKANLPPKAGGVLALLVWYAVMYVLALIEYPGLYLPLLLMVIFIVILCRIRKTAKALGEAGYTMHPAPVRVPDLWLAILLAAALVLSLFVSIWALGVAAVLVLVGALVGPLLRTLAVVFMLRLSAALLEPIADGDIVCAIGDFSRTVVLFFITMLCVGTMYFLLIVQVLLVGNLTVLLR